MVVRRHVLDGAFVIVWVDNGDAPTQAGCTGRQVPRVCCLACALRRRLAYATTLAMLPLSLIRLREHIAEHADHIRSGTAFNVDKALGKWTVWEIEEQGMAQSFGFR